MRRFIYVPSRVSTAPVFSDGESVSLNGTDEAFLNVGAGVDLLLGNEFTAAFWVKPVSLSDGARFCSFRPNSSEGHKFDIHFRNSNPNIRAIVRNSSGDVVYQVWKDDWSPTEWVHFALVLNQSDGTLSDQFKVFENASRTGFYNGPATESLPDRSSADVKEVSIGTGLGNDSGDYASAIYHSLALWDKNLSASEIAAIYSGGSGYNFDLSKNFGSYASQGNLTHWWRLARIVRGQSVDDGGGSSVDVMDDATNITVDDIVSDVPE